MLTHIPRGTSDVLPGQSAVWQWIERNQRELCALMGIREIRTPMFEHTELFARSVGDTSDVVQKQMYTFDDKGGRSLTLKPEGTAGVARAFVENHLHASTLPCKVYYVNSPVFRYESPQKGRWREHHQFGIEFFGASAATADAEIIHLAWKLFERLGIRDVNLEINSIGCPECRPKYHARLKEFFAGKLTDMCPTCRERFERNPLRILDCKEPGCKKLAVGAPSMLDLLCAECEDHFAQLQRALTVHGLPFSVDPTIVRGLDYYTKTVFELVRPGAEGNITLCGGGRYDRLIEQVGGPATPAVGFGMGTERLILALEEQGTVFAEVCPADPYDVVVLTLGDDARWAGLALVDELRDAGIRADIDHAARSLKAQFKWADKMNAPLCVIIAPDELAAGIVKLRDLRTGQESASARGGAVLAVRERLRGNVECVGE